MSETLLIIEKFDEIVECIGAACALKMLSSLMIVLSLILPWRKKDNGSRVETHNQDV